MGSPTNDLNWSSPPTDLEKRQSTMLQAIEETFADDPQEALKMRISYELSQIQAGQPLPKMR